MKPFETLPDRLDWVEMWRSHWKKDKVDPEFMGAFARVRTDE